MKQLKNIIIGSLSLLLTLASFSNVKAKECRSVYGGGEVCETGNITIDKKVWNPETNEWWDNIDSSDYVFSPGVEVKFEINIKNVSDIELDEVIIRDILPDYLDYQSSSDDGSIYGSRTVEWNKNDLNEDETETYSVVVKIKNDDYLPTGITCLTNKGEVYGQNDNTSDTDTAMFCVQNGEGEKKVLGESYPETGPSDGIWLGLEVLGFGILGGAFLAKARKNKKICY